MTEKHVFEARLTAGPEHIDELGHVNNAVWVQWIQQVAVAHWDAVARAEDKDAYYWVVVRHEIDYLRAAHEGDAISARTWVGDAPKGARFDRLMEFTGPDGKVCVRSRTQWAIIDKSLGSAHQSAAGSRGAVRFGAVSSGACARSSSTIITAPPPATGCGSP